MNKVIVVEGKNDYSKIKKVFPNSQIVITNGSAVSDDIINELKLLSKDNEIVLFLDPDYPGEKIRKTIMASIPNCSHAYIEKSKAISRNKKKVGVEHATLEDIQSSLKDINQVNSSNTTDVTFLDLYEWGLIGQDTSKEKREKLCVSFGIGYANGKQLLHKLQMFNINKEKVLEALKNDR